MEEKTAGYTVERGCYYLWTTQGTRPFDVEWSVSAFSGLVSCCVWWTFEWLLLGSLVLISGLPLGLLR